MQTQRWGESLRNSWKRAALHHTYKNITREVRANSTWGAAQCRTYRMQWEAVAGVSEVVVWVWKCLCVHVNWWWVWNSNHTYSLLSYQWGCRRRGYPANQARLFLSQCRKLWVYSWSDFRPTHDYLQLYK